MKDKRKCPFVENGWIAVKYLGYQKHHHYYEAACPICKRICRKTKYTMKKNNGCRSCAKCTPSTLEFKLQRMPFVWNTWIIMKKGKVEGNCYYWGACPGCRTLVEGKVEKFSITNRCAKCREAERIYGVQKEKNTVWCPKMIDNLIEKKWEQLRLDNERFWKLSDKEEDYAEIFKK